jgi:hypothetical protein
MSGDADAKANQQKDDKVNDGGGVLAALVNKFFFREEQGRQGRQPWQDRPCRK